MITARKREKRGLTRTSWLKSYHSFSFSDYYDPDHMAFGPLRVINEDWISPGKGFDTHGHRNMEIITYVLEGALAHKDNLGAHATITPGEVQMMSAGKGILHSEYNASPADGVHLLQIWITPDETGTPPRYQQKNFPPEEMQNRFRLLVSPDGKDGSLIMKQNARLLAAKMGAGQSLSFIPESARKYWLQLARGALDFQGQSFESGDGAAIEGERGALALTARGDAEVLLFDLPE